MVFSSLLFLYAFLPAFIAFYYLTPVRHRNGVALLGSLFFYTWGEPVFAGLLILVCLFGYTLSLWLARLPATAQAARRAVLTLGLVVYIGLLVYFKYSNFLVEQLTGPLAWLLNGSTVWTKVALPLGISFFTFQKISYLVDVYRGTTRPARSFFDYLLFAVLFPQLIAGPIIRYHDIAAQIEHRNYSLDQFLSGVWRFLLGLGRKVLIANPLGAVADKVFAHDITALPVSYAWVGIMCYTFQIYFDFAGYSDMAIGLGRMMGFEFIENFARPYTSRSITEFWHRWHISLSNFMRDYLYIPLGGNRVAPWRTKLNLWFVFLISGFWHGASWNFVFWGAYHGSLLSLERAVGRQRLARLPAGLGLILTFTLVLFGWVFFRAATLPDAFIYLHRLFDWSSAPITPVEADLLWPDLISRRTWCVLGLAALFSFLPEHWWRQQGWDEMLPLNRVHAALRIVLGLLCLLLASAALANQSYNPFIYFRF
ncbi:MAG: MBOAT family protein [Opitutaceae bacterium]|nr:MBOAT family protein [Opitutaceae bacterium]